MSAKNGQEIYAADDRLSKQYTRALKKMRVI